MMLIRKFYILLTVILVMAIPLSQAQTVSSASSVDSSFHIYLLMGQSNMAGRGLVEGKFARMKHRRVYMFDKDQNWVKAHHPVHFDKPAIVGVGPGLSFGLEMAKANKRNKIGLVPCAVGGTSIQHWKEGAYDDRTKTHPWDDGVIRISKAMQTGVIKGVIWHQGESDAAPEKAAHYLEDIGDLIERVRVLVEDPSLSFVAGELGHYKNHYDNINRVLKVLPEKVPFTAVASARGLVPGEDGVHFTSSSADLLGRRMAAKMKVLQSELSP